MGLAEYMIVSKAGGWSVLHDGEARNEYATKQAAFEAAVGAASMAIRGGHEVRIKRAKPRGRQQNPGPLSIPRNLHPEQTLISR
jgi:hypothetical protein